MLGSSRVKARTFHSFNHVGVTTTRTQRLANVLLSTRLGPITPYYGVVDGLCECGEPTTKKHKPGKHPRLVGYQSKNATIDLATITEWCDTFPIANFAVISGVATVVLDLDVRPGKNGVAELERLEREAGATVPPTVTVVSGSGSGAKHLYFRLPPSLQTLQKPKGTKGIDFLRTRQGVIVPGSLHESGNFYQFAPGLSPADVPVADLPPWLLETMQCPATSARVPGGPTTHNIGALFDEMLKIGPPPGSLSPGRLRPDEIVTRKMRNFPMRMYPDNTSFSDSHWAWTLARYCCHHWDQYLRIWQNSQIRTLPDTKCGRASYEANILEKAFHDQGQQWKNFKRRPVEQSANPALAKQMRKTSNHTEIPRSAIALAVLQANQHNPTMNDGDIAKVVNAAAKLDKIVTRKYVEQLRRRYAHMWNKA